MSAAHGRAVDERKFLGWTTDAHWLLA
jgi:hypothetical protein